MLSKFFYLVLICTIWATPLYFIRFSDSGDAYLLTKNNSLLKAKNFMCDYASSLEVLMSEAIKPDNDHVTYLIKKEVAGRLNEAFLTTDETKIDEKKLTQDEYEWVIIPRSDDEAAVLINLARAFTDIYGYIFTNILDKALIVSPARYAKALPFDSAKATGLPNVGGVSCFMNASLQMLYSVTLFRRNLSELVGVAEKNGLRDDSIAKQLDRIFKLMEQGKGPSADSMKTFLRSLDKRGEKKVIYGQSDVIDALKLIVQLAEQDLAPFRQPIYPSAFYDIFYVRGVQLTTTQNKEEVLLTASLDDFGIADIFMTEEQVENNTKVDLEALLRTRNVPEKYAGGYTINQFKSFPPYIITNISRNKDGRRANNLVNVPLEIDFSQYLSNYSGEKLTYRLVAVANHHGESGGSGHYTATVWKDSKDGSGVWHSFNDSSVAVSDPPVGATVSGSCFLYRSTTIPLDYVGENTEEKTIPADRIIGDKKAKDKPLVDAKSSAAPTAKKPETIAPTVAASTSVLLPASDDSSDDSSYSSSSSSEEKEEDRLGNDSGSSDESVSGENAGEPSDIAPSSPGSSIDQVDEHRKQSVPQAKKNNNSASPKASSASTTDQSPEPAPLGADQPLTAAPMSKLVGFIPLLAILALL